MVPKSPIVKQSRRFPPGLFWHKLAEAVDFALRTGARVENIPVGADFAVFGFLHVEPGVETARLAFFLQSGPDSLAITGDEVKIPATEHLHAQDAVHRQTFADFPLSISDICGVAGLAGTGGRAGRTLTGHANNYALAKPHLCPAPTGGRHEYAIGSDIIFCGQGLGGRWRSKQQHGRKRKTHQNPLIFITNAITAPIEHSMNCASWHFEPNFGKGLINRFEKPIFGPGIKLLRPAEPLELVHAGTINLVETNGNGGWPERLLAIG